MSLQCSMDRELSRENSVAHFQVSAVTGLAGPPEIFLFGSEGTLRYVPDTLYAGTRETGKLEEVQIPPERQGRWRGEEEFIEAIRGQGVITHTTFADGVKYMEFTEAVTRSMATGTTVPLPLSD